MGITLGNPIEITSGTFTTLITNRNICIDKLYWLKPVTLATTSSEYGVTLKKNTSAGPIIAKMLCETDGQSQVVSFDDGKWTNKLFCDGVGSGTLYIYLR